MGTLDQQQQQHSIIMVADNNGYQSHQHQQHQQHHHIQQQQQQQQQQHAMGAHENEQSELEIGSEFDAFPHGEECTAVLTMKCGEPLMAVRKKLHDEITFTFVPEEGFGVFQSKVERHYNKLGKAFVQEKRGIYLKPSSNATQTKYVLLTESNFDPLLRMRWKIARSMKVDLKYEVFAYFIDTASKKDKKRLSMKMFHHESPHVQQQQQQAQQAHAELSSAHFGGFATSAHGFPLSSAQSISQAIQTYADLNSSIGTSLIGKSSSSSSSKLASSTGMLLANGKADESDRPRKIVRTTSRGPAPAVTVPDLVADDEPFFQPIPFRINGFVVPLEVDVTALRRALGLATAQNAAAVAASLGSSSVSDSGDLDPQSTPYDR